MLARLKSENLDLVIGSRNVEGGSMGRFGAWRVRLSNLGRVISRRVISCELQDPMSGFFVADRRFINIALPRTSAIGFKILLDLIASSPRPVRLGRGAVRVSKSIPRRKQAGHHSSVSSISLWFFTN